jgi:hypothetical protein
VGSPLDEARALVGIGRYTLATGATDRLASMQQALEIFQRLGAAEATELAAELEAFTNATRSPRER